MQIKVTRLRYEGELKGWMRVQASEPNASEAGEAPAPHKLYFPPITSLAIVANCMLEVPS